jgi:hypothetical protein
LSRRSARRWTTGVKRDDKREERQREKKEREREREKSPGETGSDTALRCDIFEAEAACLERQRENLPLLKFRNTFSDANSHTLRSERNRDRWLSDAVA